ncbi:MAG: hypothetical protein ACKO96_40825 [Flammeovirgaceae bacterium]
MQTDLRQKLLSAHNTLSYLETLPSGKGIFDLKEQLSDENLIKAGNYIPKFVLESLLLELSPEQNQKLLEMAENNQVDDFSITIGSIVAVDERLSKIVNHALNTAIRVVANEYKVNLN